MIGSGKPLLSFLNILFHVPEERGSVRWPGKARDLFCTPPLPASGGMAFQSLEVQEVERRKGFFGLHVYKCFLVCLLYSRPMSVSDRLLAWDPVERRPAERLIPHKSVQFSPTSNYVIPTSAVRGGRPRPAVARCAQHIRWFIYFFSNKNKSSKFMKNKIK